jgi:hypothetical protein
MVLSPKDHLLEHSAEVLRWLEEPAGRLFSSWLLELHSRETRRLKDSEKEIDVFRAQGSVGILDVLMRIKEDLRRYEQDVIAGRCQPIKETPAEKVVSVGLAR